MKHLTLLIKPVSGNCNLCCSYCFYIDEMEHRERASYGRMSETALEALIRFAFREAEKEVTFMFQGGEPVLAGIPFYQKLMELEQKHNTNNLTIHHAIQTNGTLLNEEWAGFLKQHSFLVGLSMDGTRTIHDLYRMDGKGNGSFKEVLRAAKLMDAYHIQYNILTVVTAAAAEEIEKIYSFFKFKGWYYQQYIACLDSVQASGEKLQYAPSSKQYAEFLKKLFDAWYGDIIHRRPVYIRYFENLAGMEAGYPPESCCLAGHCVDNLVVEADGSVYPCDFYVMDGFEIGNVHTDSLEQINKKRKEIGFIESSRSISAECRTCEWWRLCKGGCRRERESDGILGLNRYCSAYKEFFPYIYERLQKLKRHL